MTTQTTPEDLQDAYGEFGRLDDCGRIVIEYDRAGSPELWIEVQEDGVHLCDEGSDGASLGALPTPTEMARLIERWRACWVTSEQIASGDPAAARAVAAARALAEEEVEDDAG